MKLKCLDEENPDLSKIRPKFDDLISKDFVMSVDSALTKRHYTVTLFDNVAKQNVNEEIDNLFFETDADNEEPGGNGLLLF